MIDTISKIPFYITDQDREKYIWDIEKLFENDIWRKDVPLYQTWWNLFTREEEHWQNLKYRIISIIALLNPELKNIKCWAYASFVGKKGSLSRGWHEHSERSNRLSCLIYLQISDPRNGTMFDLGENIVTPKVCINTLYIYNSNISHTPTYWDYENQTKNRYVLSMDTW